MLNKILRKPYRNMLTTLTTKALAKHNPTVVAIMGDGQTSIGREMIYSLIKTKFPVRRNLEAPEAEFSIPLTVLGYPNYPNNYLEWGWVLIKSHFLLKKNPSYRHFLILELNFTHPGILAHWLKVLKPETALIVGKVPLDYSEFGIKKVVKISNTHPEEILKPFEIAAIQIGRFYRINPDDVDNAIKNFSLPSPKIRFYPGINGSILIDATHYYFPIKLEAVLELVSNGEEPTVGNNIIYTNLKKDKHALKSKKDWKINPKDYKPQPDDTVVIRGDRIKNIQKYDYLFESKVPLV
ncbi:hypothetical protein ACFLZK_02260 [Patescibacteria group bacterium]